MTKLQLAPEVLERLHHLQQADRPVSVDEILQAANLNHLALPCSHLKPSKSAETRHLAPLRLEKSTSTLTLAERRRIPVSPQKLKLYAKISTNNNNDNNNSSSTDRDEQMKKLEKENAKLPPQDSEEYLLSRLERQNALLQADPKSISMEANRLQADFDTLRQLVDNHSTALTSPLSPDTSEISDWDFWQCLVEDFPTAVAKLPHLVSAKLRHGGIPHPLRGVMWQAMAQSASTRLETMYDDLLNNNNNHSSPYARVIQRDLSRTFPTVDMFKSDGGLGQQAMERILTSYSIYDVQVGYCQGLAFLVGPLLMTMPEKQAFCVFVRLMETYEMRTMFTLNMEGLHLRLHQFQTLLSQFCPRLDAHLSLHSIHPAMYASQWYLTLFAYSLPIHVVMRIYDLVFAEGAVETITRVAIAMMQKNEDTLLAIHDFEQLMMYLSSKQLYETAYDSDAEAVIADTMALSHAITKAKMDDIADTHDKELEQEKNRAHQVLAIRFGGWKRSSTSSLKSPTSSSSNKRDSWFSWRADNNKPMVQSPTTPTSPIPTSAISVDRTVPMLHQQIEDLVLALSQLQKEHSHLTEQVMTMKMHAMDYTAANDKLMERNSILTRRLRKYRSMSNSSQSFSSLVDKANASRLQVLEKDQEFREFVSTLQMTGDFGSLIASALTSQTNDDDDDDIVDLFDDDDNNKDHNNNSNDDDDDYNDNDSYISHTSPIASTTATTATSNNDDDIETITQELVTLKLANFEMGQKYEAMCHQNEALTQQLNLSQNKEQMYLDQMALLEKVAADQAQEIDTMAKANETLSERMMATKQTSAELHMEKLALTEQVTRLEQHVRDLEREKQEYLKPRDSFSEEVFAAHHTLFGEGSVFHQQQQQTSSSKRQQHSDPEEYQRKYVDAELRCRELEKLLAETKCKLVEYEAAPKRPTSLVMMNNRNSTGLMLSTARSTAMVRDESTATRMSTDSMSTTTSSKRSSVYSRLWNSMASPTTPSSTDILPFNNNMKSPEVYPSTHQPTDYSI
ncbi:rab-GTPase-TBC domain-containing protein [Halteromyces radiatus]|uniref:rab-GTPase-TBC domain-containing protein n=1 Tax=Halteromyces radiatus TaxID=101107 RepID=UPI00221F8A0D|nr:rab-GTPase-TBC domain-containing protein [Halteromyces radiatus]KAI8079919.1 rab-GTPase-TBC domain-containing protein [Halteromyces radiatus]